MWAAENGYNDVISNLIVQNASVNLQNRGGWTALMNAAKNGHNDVVSTLLANNATTDNQSNENGGWTALMYAARNGHGDVVTNLIESGAAVDIESRSGEKALDIAEKEGFEYIASLLKQHQGGKLSTQ